jgi:hypothetical protein
MNYSQINNRLPFLHLTAGKDALRDAMMHVQIKTFNEPGTYGPAGIYATATDAHTLVYCNLADHIGNLQNVPGPEILIKADQYKKLTGPKVYFLDFAQPGQIVTRDKAGQQLDAVPYITPEHARFFPSWPDVLPTAEPEPTGVIGIHPEKIGKICDILNAGALIFEFRGPTRPIMAQYGRSDEHGIGKALIMPIVISETWQQDREKAQEWTDKMYQKAQGIKERTEGTTA